MGWTKQRGPADPLSDSLRWYFQDSESVLGQSSSFGAFVDMAMSGVLPGGRSNGVERKAVAIVNHRRNDASQHRAMRTRLQRLGEQDPRLLTVLWLAYGPTDWVRVVDSAGRGMGERFVRALGAERIGVALLTDRLSRAHADEIGPELEVTDGLNRWALATITRAGEPLYRCAGPLVHVDRRRVEAEADAGLRLRAIRAAGGCPLRLEHAALYDASGKALDVAADEVGVVRKPEREEQVIAPPAPARERPVCPAPGALLTALVAAAYPEAQPKKSKQKAAQTAALRRVNEIRDEAVMLLARARLALPPDAGAKAPPPPIMPRPERVRAAMARRSRPVQVYPSVPELASEALRG